LRRKTGRVRAGMSEPTGMGPPGNRLPSPSLATRDPSPRRRAARLVRPPPPGAALARRGRPARPIPRLAVGGHAPADDRCGGGAEICALPGPLPRCAGAGRRAMGRGRGGMGGARLLCAGAQPARRGQGAGGAQPLPGHGGGAARHPPASAPTRPPPSPPSPSTARWCPTDGNVER
jgi:hypothetical protein